LLFYTNGIVLRQVRHIYSFLFVFLTSSFFSFAQTPSWAWAKDAHSTASEWANDVAVDTSSGDVVVVGVFNSDLSAFYGSNFAGAVGGGFVARYNSAGNVLWAFPIGNNQDDACNSLAIAPSGNIYVTGYFQNIADFKGTLSTPSTILTSNGGKDVFLAKYNPSGQLLWVRKAGGITDDEGYAVCTNTSLVFITGYFTGSGSFGGIPTVSNAAGENIFAAAYDASGNIQWLTDGGSGMSSFARDITADNNDVYITGDFKNGTLGIYDYMGANVANLANSAPASEDAFVLSLAVNGPFNWIRGIHSSNSDFGRGIAQNSSGVYVTGSLSSSATFPSYVSNPVNTTATGLDMYVAQLSKASGNTNWVASEPGANDEEGIAIAIDTVNGITVTGYLQSTMVLAGTTTITSSGNEDVYVAMYNTSGNFKWATLGGDNGVDIPYGISTATTGEILVAGEYENIAKFGGNALTPDSPKNIFVAKLGCAALKTNGITADQTICAGQIPAMLNGSVPTGAPGPYGFLWQQSPDNLIWSSASGINNTQDYSPPALTASTYFRRAVSTLTGCITSDTSLSILITVDQPPTTANAGIDSSICVSSINLFGNTPTVGTATWTLVSGTGTVTTVGSPTTAVSGLSTGNNIFAWTITNGVCPASSDTVDIKVYAIPTAASAGTDQNICASTYTLNGNTPSIGTGSWTVIAGSATVTSASSPNSGASGLSNGLNIFVWTISNGPCTASSDTVVITKDIPPSVSNAGSDQNICSSNFTLSATSPSVGSGSWNVVSGGSSVTTPTLNTSAVTGLSLGINTFEWVVTNGTCAASSDTVSITVDAVPTTANAGTDQTICASSDSLNANVPSVGTGTWSVFAGGSTIVSPGTPNSQVTNLSTGNNILVWTITNGTCPASSDSVTITVDAMPTASNAGSPQTLCNDSVLLNANIPSVGTGTWSVVSGGASVSNPMLNNSIAFGLSTGNNVFMWSIGNGVCPVSTSTVQVTVDPMPSAAVAGTDQTLCSTSATLSATSPVTGTGNWNVLLGGATVNTPSVNNTSVSGLSVGVNSFEWVVSNGTCPASRDTVQIMVDANPSQANAGSPQTICASSGNLNAMVPAIGSGSWTVISGGSSVTSPSQNSSPVTGLSIGTNSFAWTVSNGTCPPTGDTAVIFVDTNPTPANAGSDQTLCAGTSTLSANVPVTGSGVWTVVSGGATVISPTQAAATVSGLTTGQNIFIWTISNGSCPASADTIIVNVDAMPSLANAGPSQNVCSTSANLNAVPPVVGSGSWTVMQGGASVTSPSSSNSGVTGLTGAVNVFQWTVSNGTCPSNSDTVVIDLNFLPSASNAGADQTICASTSSLTANSPLVGAGLWSVVSGGANVISAASSITSLSNLSTGQNIFVWTISNGVCPPSSDTVVVNVSAQPTPPNAGPDQNVCINSSAANLAATIPAIGTGTWTQITGAGVISNSSQYNSAVTGLSLGQNSFVWTIASGVCSSLSDTTRIFVYSNPSTANAGPDVSVSGSFSTLNGNVPSVGTGMWSLVSGAGSFVNALNPGTQVIGLGIGDNVLGWTISNGVCPDSYDEVIIHVNDLVVPNGFSPNGDFVNDHFEIPGLDVFANVKLEVFNRWGNLVYENDNYKNDWDGKNRNGEDLTDDTYYFTLVVTQTKTYKGFVVLKRK